MTYLLFFNYLNSKHKKIRFTYEKESKNSLPFLDILISKSENDFKTSVYHKQTFSGVYSNFNSFIYDPYKISLIFTLLFRTFSVVSDFSKFHTEVSHVKEILRKNAFPIRLVGNCIKSGMTFYKSKSGFIHTSTIIHISLIIKVNYKISM